MYSSPFFILKTRWNNNTVMSEVLSESISENYSVLKNIIPQSVHFVEAESAGLSVFEYNKRSRCNAALLDLAREILEEVGHEV